MGLATICLLWAGLILGVSFIATPIKFTVVPLDVALDLGRHVFGIFDKIELGCALIAIALFVATRPKAPVAWPLAIAIIALGLQSWWLLPAMNHRIDMILGGQTPHEAPYHLFYVGLEFCKLAGLLTAGWGSMIILKSRVPQAAPIDALSK
jgi:hypothetical protein